MKAQIKYYARITLLKTFITFLVVKLTGIEIIFPLTNHKRKFNFIVTFRESGQTKIT